MEQLIAKVIKDAEQESRMIIDNADKELQKKLADGKTKIESESRVLLKSRKAEVEKKALMDVANYRLKKEQQVLELKNSYIDKVLDKTRDIFNKYIIENTGEIIESLTRDLQDKNIEFTVSIPDDKEISLDGKKFGKVKRDSSLDKAIRVESKDWDITFDWEKIEVVIGQHLREQAGKKLFAGTGSSEKE